jgi:hypothetical protein
MRTITIFGDPRTAINAMIEQVLENIFTKEEVRVYFLFNEEIFKRVRSVYRRELAGVILVRTSPKKFYDGRRFYGLDFYVDNTLRNHKIREGLESIRQL